MDPKRVGTAIRALRLQAGYTQHDIADVLGVTDQAVSKWERGLSVPDVSIVTKLSIFLNVDVDNLLEGNITYLEKNWQGLLLLQDTAEIYSGSLAYGKPLVYLYLSYFMLAGIGEIYIICSDRDRKYIEDTVGNGKKYGIRIAFITDESQMQPRNTMVVYNNPFIYGPNLTKYFQRAMSRTNGISVLTVTKTIGESEIMVSYDNYKAVRSAEDRSIEQFCAPIVFFPKVYFDQVGRVLDTQALDPLYAEPMGNGMIEYSITDEDSLWDTSLFLRYLIKRMGKDIYDPHQVAKNRNFIDGE